MPQTSPMMWLAVFILSLASWKMVMSTMMWNSKSLSIMKPKSIKTNALKWKL